MRKITNIMWSLNNGMAEPIKIILRAFKEGSKNFRFYMARDISASV